MPSRARRNGADDGCGDHRGGAAGGEVIINIDRFGNTTSATIPLAMETARQEGKLKKGDLILIASVGAGFTVGAGIVEMGNLRGAEFRV
jgi:3-oxoacyl-[acyl-carrier-protein] synthase III